MRWRAPLVTCEAVIAEACHLLRKEAGAPEAILENVERGIFRLPFRLEESASAVRALMKRYARVPMDFADACLVSLAETLGTGRILTLDSDFHVYRWRRTRPLSSWSPRAPSGATLSGQRLLRSAHRRLTAMPS